MNQIPVGGQPSSGLQDPRQLYSPASQTQLPLPPGGQQVPRACGQPWTRRHMSLPWAGGGRGALAEPQFTSLQLGASIQCPCVQFPKTPAGSRQDCPLGPLTSHLAKQRLLGEGGPPVSGLFSLSLSLLSFSLASLSATLARPPCPWQVPACGPVWLPVWSTASLPPAPHGCALISGTAPQTLPQAHLLIQVRSRVGRGYEGLGEEG